MERIKRFCNALFFMAYILFLTIVFQKFICSFHGIDTNIVQCTLLLKQNIFKIEGTDEG